MPNAQVKSYVSTKPSRDEFLITTDAHFYITGITDQLLELSGKQKEKLLGAHISFFLDTQTPSGHSLIPTSFAAAAAGTLHFEAVIPAHDGKPIPTNWQVTPLRNNGDEKITSLSWRGIKIEGFKHLTEHASADEWALIDNVSDSIIAIDLDMNILTWNKAAEELYGLKSEDVIGRSLPELIQYEYINDSRQQASETLLSTGKWQGEVIYTRKDGLKLHLFSSVSMMKDKQGKSYGIVAVNRNITSRTEADAELGRKEKLLSAIANASNELIARNDHFKVIEDCLASIAKAADAERATLMQYVNNDGNDANYFSLKFEWYSNSCACDSGCSRLSSVRTSQYSDVNSTLFNGKVFSALVDDIKDPLFKEWLRSHELKSILAVPIFSAGKFWGVISWFQCSYARIWKTSEIDIFKTFVFTLSAAIERNNAYKRLQDSEEKLKALFQHSVDIVFVVDEDLRVKYVTSAIEKVLGYKEEALTSSTWLDLVHEQDVRKIKEQLKNLVLHSGNNLLINIRVLNSSGEWMWMEVKGQNQLANLNIHGLVLSLRDISERQNAQQILAAYSETISGILNSITDGFAALDKDFNVKLWNHVAEKVTGITKDKIIGKNLWGEFPALMETTLKSQCNEAHAKKITVNFAQYFPALDRWFDVSIYPYDDGLFMYFKDVTEKKKQEMLLALEKNVLELNSKPETSLKTTVDYLLEGLQEINKGVVCSVLMLDENKRIKHLSAPGLPEEYRTSIDGAWIGPDEGSCGTAMYRKQTVIVEDINTSPLWDKYREIAVKHNLQACWSVPILNAQEKVIGSFACYHYEPKSPSMAELDLIERTANLLRVIIENKKAEEQVRISNDRYLLATRATNEAIWDWDLSTDELYWGEGFYSLFGYNNDEEVTTYKFWQTHIHPDDRWKVRNGIEDFIRNKNAQLWIDEYRYMKADGNYAIVLNKGYLICDSQGQTIRMVGSIEDVTEKKRLEKKLIKQELDKQKLVAQAVVDAQEKERGEIGKELHDNVNQILSTAKLFLEVAKTNNKERSKLIIRSAAHIHHAINEIRNISRSLVPPSISDLGLIESIKDLLENIAVTKTLKVDFTNVGDIENGINDNQKLMLFRIIQEQVSNVLRHAEAKHLSILLSVSNIGIELVIADDGKGFDLENNKTKKGVGLSNIASRVELFNGKVNIVTAPGKGCRLIVKVLPISNYK
jgi:PAS domain S-box-containing protein